MPVSARGKEIVEKKTGRVVGHSKTEAMAKKAARTRNAVVEGGLKIPVKRGPRRSVSY